MVTGPNEKRDFHFVGSGNSAHQLDFQPVAALTAPCLDMAGRTLGVANVRGGPDGHWLCTLRGGRSWPTCRLSGNKDFTDDHQYESRNQNN